MTTAALNPGRSSPLRGLAWVTWRQHRAALIGVLAALGGLGLLLLVTGLGMHREYHSLGLDTCGQLNTPTCQNQLLTFRQDYGSWADHLPALLMLVPGLIGVFAGAPLVARELESGTFRFAWTQGRSRVQWLTTKLILLGIGLTALTLAFSALFTWWYGPFDNFSGRMSPYGAYEISGLVFAARTLFGFTAGVLLGLLIRRTVPAMAATAAGWLAVAISSMTYLRPMIRQPLIAQIPLPTAAQKIAGGTGGHVPANADVISNWYQNASGQHLAPRQLFDQAIAAVGGPGADPGKVNDYLSQHHYTQWVSYRPDTWFWHVQTLEAAGYAILAMLLAVAAVLLLRRRAT